MQSDHQDEQRTLPQGRDGEPDEAGEAAPAPDPAEATPNPQPSGGQGPDAPRPASPQPAPPRMPGTPGTAVPPGSPPPGAPPPQMPGAPSGTPPPQMPAPPRMPGPRSSTAWGATQSPTGLGGTAPAPAEPSAPEASASEAEPAPVTDATRAPDEGPEVDGDAAGAEPTTGDGAARPAARSVAPVVQGDWLASVCPYLTSHDGAYRSATPDEGHRCVAVDPPATLPLAFQERFCLTDQHPRCEMYKYAQEVGQDGGVPVPATELQAAATRPVQAASESGGGSSNRNAIIAAASVGGLAILVLLLVLVMGSCSGGGSDGEDEGTAEPAATEEPRPEPTPGQTSESTPEPTSAVEPDPDATAQVDPDVGTQGLTILYEIQEGEALLRVADTFGVTRRRLLRANPGLEEVPPADLPGETIEIPVPAGTSLEELEALPGYRGPVP